MCNVYIPIILYIIFTVYSISICSYFRNGISLASAIWESDCPPWQQVTSSRSVGYVAVDDMPSRNVALLARKQATSCTITCTAIILQPPPLRPIEVALGVTVDAATHLPMFTAIALPDGRAVCSKGARLAIYSVFWTSHSCGDWVLAYT